MRFAYIDSNGNEVPIPSVDALALRIELGAITENTQLYDAQADEWGPAHTHEIFHTLSRDAGDDGFVAPPPVAPPPAKGGSEEAEAPSTESAQTPEVDAAARSSEPAAPEADTPEPAAPEAEESEAAPPEPEGPDESFGLTLAAPPPSEDDAGGGAGPEPTERTAAKAEKTEPAPSTSRPLGPDDDLPYLDLGEDDEDEEPMDVSSPADTTESEDAGEEAVFDFGGMEGGLEVEEPFEAPDHEPMDLSRESGPVEDSDGGMELETAMEFESGGFEGHEDESLDLETPMSQFSPDEPPSWMEEDAGSADEGVLDFSAAGTAPDETDTEVPLRDRRPPRSRPSPPRFKKQRNLAVPIVGIVVLLAVGIGGYVAWPIVSDRLAPSESTEEQGVRIPALSEELTPVMREASSAAIAAVFDDARAQWAESDPLPVPPEDWLAGAYLANAGEYPRVETFWQGVADFVDIVRGIELSTFDAALVAELGRRDLSEADATAIRERADSGFVAAAADRAAAVQELDALIDGALALHQFLVANQEDIEYAPASIVTTDPVLEVEHATPAIEAAMNDRLDDYFRAQQALGVRDRPRAEVLQERLESRIQESGIR